MASDKGMQSREAEAAMASQGLVIPAELWNSRGRRDRVAMEAKKAKGLMVLCGEIEGEDMLGALHTHLTSSHLISLHCSVALCAMD